MKDQNVKETWGFGTEDWSAPIKANVQDPPFTGDN